MKNKAWIFVNSFSFNFLEFLMKIYWANFFPWAKKAKKGGTRETRPDRPPDRSDRPSGAPAAVCPGFSSKFSFSTSFFAQKILREVRIRKMRFLGFSLSDYLFGQIGSSGIHPI
jgi:hypothetical protein